MEPQVYLKDAGGWPGQVFLEEACPGLKLARKTAAESPKVNWTVCYPAFSGGHDAGAEDTQQCWGWKLPGYPEPHYSKVWSQEGAICPTWELASDAKALNIQR